MRWQATTALVALAVAGMASTGGLASAGPAEPDAASALFTEGKAMMDKGNFAEACPRLARSEELDPQVGTMLNLATCYQSLGDAAQACSWWRAAADAAAEKSQPDRETYAREQAETTCPSASPAEPIQVSPPPTKDDTP